MSVMPAATPHFQQAKKPANGPRFLQIVAKPKPSARKPMQFYSDVDT
jgi:hypothetical protein